MIIKEKFKERYEQLTEWEPFIKCSLSFLRRSIRVNTLKISVDELKECITDKWKLISIPWCREGFWVENYEGRRDIGNLKEHSIGYFYVQEAASMIPPIVLEPKAGEFILDMCAAPGSKTTQIAQYMKNNGVLIANDYTGDRIKSLGINVQKCGLTNHIITMMQGHRFQGFSFDRILVDAPCSGTGTIRKSLKTLLMWNPNGIKKLAGQQRQLIEAAFNNLKKDGTLVYSTCSLEPEENEGVVDYLVNKYDDARIEKIELPLKKGKPILEFEGKEYNKEIKNTLRLWPQDNDTEGFFVAKIRKE
ncbi:RsmB/NOP family class I SAM-dependent RNA methyltransferase [Candidatus Woesearchaeota archaeon]|nr:RsmB/NOP family class I SAM-dependent RNA methyltransferase [Candidatus Woesearchaeota archaeon]